MSSHHPVAPTPRKPVREWTLVARPHALLIVLGSIVLAGIAISPPVADRSHSALFHYTQHAFIFIAGALDQSNAQRQYGSGVALLLARPECRQGADGRHDTMR